MYKLEDRDYFELWKHFQEKADKVKEAMFATLTWTIGFAAALLGYIFVNLTSFDPREARVSLTAVVSMSATAGLVICLYSWFMLSESAKHIEGNWGRANRCRDHVNGLAQLDHRDGRRRGKVMKIWNQLRIIVVIFAAAFVAILAWQLVDAGMDYLPAKLR